VTESVETSALTPLPGTTGQTGTVVRSTVLKRLFKNPLGIVAMAILLVLALMAVFADVLAPFDENFANISKTLASPDSVNILGTDSSGRDVWSCAPPSPSRSACPRAWSPATTPASSRPSPTGLSAS
jgi:hypothetical protein